MTTVNSVFNFLAEDTAARLTQVLLTDVIDDSKAGIVQAGIARGFPNDTKITLTVETGDEKWRHTSNMSSQNVGMQAPFGEIGGGIYERLRFIVNLDIIFDASVDQDQARTIANVVLSRSRHALSNKADTGLWWFRTTADDFEEQASRVFVYDSYMAEGGSEGKWRWRGAIFIEFLTERVGCV